MDDHDAAATQASTKHKPFLYTSSDLAKARSSADMPVTFGAVGDIISVCLLLKDLVESLDQARGSKAEYESVIRELWILDRTLLEIEALSRIHVDRSAPELQGLRATANEAVTRCNALVDAFLQRIRRYQNSLGEGERSNVLHGAVMKVRWRLGEKEALDQFRVEIAGTTSSLQMLLATESVCVNSILGYCLFFVTDTMQDLDEYQSKRSHGKIRRDCETKHVDGFCSTNSTRQHPKSY